MKKFTKFISLFIVTVMLLSGIVIMPSMAETPFISRVNGKDNNAIFGIEDLYYSDSRVLNVSKELSDGVMTLTASETATETGNNKNYARLHTIPFDAQVGTTVLEFDSTSYRALDKGLYIYFYYGKDWNQKTKIKDVATSASYVMAKSERHNTIVMTTTQKEDGSKVASFKVDSYDAVTDIPVIENGRIMIYIDKFFYSPATETSEAEASWAKIYNFHMYHSPETAFKAQKQQNGNIAFNLPVSAVNATVNGTEATVTKVNETETSINEYSIGTSNFEVGTHKVSVTATSIYGEETTLEYDIAVNPPFLSRITTADGVLINELEDFISTDSVIRRTTRETSGNSGVFTATTGATTYGNHTNYIRIYSPVIPITTGTTVMEFDAKSFRAADKAVYIYLFYGPDWNGKTAIKPGSVMTVSDPGHITVVMKTTENEDGTRTATFTVNSVVTAENVPVDETGRFFIYIDKFYYVPETETTPAEASTATISNFHMYQTPSVTFAGENLENGNVAFNMPVEEITATIDGDEVSVTKVPETETAINEYKVDTEYLGSGRHTVSVSAKSVDGTTATVNYETDGVYPEFEAEITKASGGADSIVSMTFDDGLYDTALLLNEKFEKYGLKGSTMLISDRIADEETIAKWQEIYDKGYLAPESHSATHKLLPTDEIAEKEATGEDGTVDETKKQQLLSHNTEENYQKELVQSKSDIESRFNTSVVGFAAAYNVLSEGAYDVAMNTYHGIRMGSRGIQSLDPETGNEKGQWHNLYMRSFSDAKNDSKVLCDQIGAAVKAKGWYISLCHGVGDSGDITEENADVVFSHISELVKNGKVWCTTFGDAIKYVRERQASTLNASLNGDVITLDLTREMTTEDNLPLVSEVFNVPLTVKVLLPEGWLAVNATQNDETTFVTATRKAGVSYAYIDIVPNSGTVTLTEAEIKEQPLGEPYLTLKGMPTEVFFEGDYKVVVPVSQRADTEKFTVVAAQYQNKILVDVSADTYEVTKEDGDTELELDISVKKETDELVCMVWDGYGNMKPLLAVPKKFSPVTKDENAPYVILKFDDLGANTVGDFQSAYELCKKLDTVASFGVIGERFNEDTANSVYETIKGWHNDGFEIWHHGFDHSTAEYSTCTYDEQKEFFGKTLDLMEEKCGITITTFGSPYNNSTETTRSMIEEQYPQIKAIMLADYAGTDKIKVLDSRINLESKTGVIASYKTFQNRYAKRGTADYIILQGHPSAWSEESFLNLELNIKYLKEKGCKFITPSEYLNK
ncbi:MAG: polysaccharide deacetylase family protein [Clostridia bacterium]|nr:polysaccharide deacetylase family protein [Clostridia bacterium]